MESGGCDLIVLLVWDQTIERHPTQDRELLGLRQAHGALASEHAFETRLHVMPGFERLKVLEPRLARGAHHPHGATQAGRKAALPFEVGNLLCFELQTLEHGLPQVKRGGCWLARRKLLG